MYFVLLHTNLNFMPLGSDLWTRVLIFSKARCQMFVSEERPIQRNKRRHSENVSQGRRCQVSWWNWRPDQRVGLSYVICKTCINELYLKSVLYDRYLCSILNWISLFFNRIAFVEFKNKTIAKKIQQKKRVAKLQGRVLTVDFVGEANRLKVAKANDDDNNNNTEGISLGISKWIS